VSGGMIARAVIASVLLLAGAGASAQERDRLALQTNEADIAELQGASTLASALAINDPLAVLLAVLGSLPERVKVLPTENYYYVRFAHKGVRYVGNIRLAAADRDDGKVHFSFSEEPTDWNAPPDDRHGTFGAGEGVSVQKVAALEYRVSARGKSVSFALNDLSKVRPPAGYLTEHEQFLGPVFDESGIRFFFVFNTRLKVFHFLLDETEAVADEFVPARTLSQTVIGKRTGFALYLWDKRKILIGVNARQSRLNTSLDGPFDQLPENFIEGDSLRDAMTAADPGVRGKIDRLGNFIDGSARFLVHPYMPYREVGDLAVFHRCVASRAVKPADRPMCFVITDDEAQRRNPRPLALKRR
jgi:hypothetical protein